MVAFKMVAFKIHLFDASLFEEIEIILRFANHLHYECFLHYFEGCPRVSSFHLNNLDNNAGNE